MSLKMLLIKFQSVNDTFTEINNAITSRTGLVQDKHSLFFDSIKTFRQFLTLQKIEILTAISRVNPSSIYQLAKQLDRQPHHVLKDCRSLESHGFIKLTKSDGKKGQLRPELAFDYDVIHVLGSFETFHPISVKSCRVLDELVAI